MSQANHKTNWLKPILSPNRWQFLRTSLRNQLSGITVLMALVPVLIVSIFIGALTIALTRSTLQADALAQLESVRTIKSAQLTAYYFERVGDAKVTSQNRQTLDALTSLNAGFNAVGASAVRALYLGKPDRPDAGDSSTYTAAQRQFSTYLSNFVSAYSYYDVFLINRDGQVVYTYAKEDDFGTNLVSGKYVDTNLARVFQAALKLKQGETTLSDFQFYAPSANAPASFTAAPIYDSGQVVGVLAFQLPLDKITAIMQERTGLGDTGETYLVGADHLFRSESRFVKNSLLTVKVDTEAANNALSGNSGSALITDYRGTPVLSAWQPVKIGDLQWAFIAEIDQSEAFAAVNQLTTFVAAVGSVAGFIVIVLALVVAFLVSRSFVRPILELKDGATAVASGKLDTVIASNREDELGVLASAFNSMTAQLRNIIDTLEERVAERTHSLELAADVGRSISQVRALDVMLKDAAEIIRARFDLYYTQVYLTNPAQNTLILQAGTGTVGTELVGRGHRLPLNTASINGRAAVEKRSVVISDTATSTTFRPNPLLPDTRSEMAVPLLVGERVVGVLDLQSNKAGSLSQDILPAFEALAGQLAIAIQNASLLAEAEQARAEVEKQARRLIRANWVDYLDAIHEPEQIGFMFQGDQVRSLTEAEQPELVSGLDTLAAPISVGGEKMGTLVVEMEEQKRSSQMENLTFAVARQVAQQIENLRLLDSAERYRFEAEQASHRLTREAWKDYMGANAGEGMSYIYDLKEVRAHDHNTDQQVEESAFSLPLKVRDETVGKLVVQGLEPDNTDALELVNAVAERLGAHIEGLRLSQQTEQVARREHALRQITNAVRGSTDPATILRAAVRELGTILGRKTVIRLATSDQTRQPDSVAISGDETAPLAGSPNAVGGDE